MQAAIAEAKFRKLTGFILDLRDGYGGAWWDYLDPFFPDRKSYFSYSVSNSEGKGVTHHAGPKFNSDAWPGPLAVITNGGTRSGKESLAFQFKQTGRGKVFGATTSGAFTLGKGVFVDRDADYLLYLSVSELQLNGQPIEGVGITPDVFVPKAIGYDAPLTSALNYLACSNEHLRTLPTTGSL